MFYYSMNNYARKILYIGAGYDIKPVMHFPETKEFVFIDSQPRIKNEKLFLEPEFNKKEYNSDFVNNLLLSCLYYGFTLESTNILDKNYYKKIISKKMYYISWFKKLPKHINPTILEFINKETQQRITYYISTNINFNMNNRLLFDISSSDSIIVTDYFPEINVLEHFGSSKIFIGYSNINYQNGMSDKHFKNDLLYFLHNYSCNRRYYFSDFHIVDDETGTITKCQDFNDFLVCNVDCMDDK